MSTRAHLRVAGLLAAAMALAIVVGRLPLPRALRWPILAVLALGQFAAVVRWTMQLGDEPRPLGWAFASSLALPVLYAAALVSEALVGRHGP